MSAIEHDRLIQALQNRLDDASLPDLLRQLSGELQRRISGEQRYAELYHSEMTARAQAEEALRAVAQTEARCREAHDLAQAASKAKDHFLAVLSHELRTPLQPVLAAASALLRDPRLPKDILDDVRTIQRNVQLEARLIDDMLDLTRIAAGKLSLTCVPVNIDSVIARSIDICEPDVMARKLTLSVSSTAAPRKWVHADPGRLQQILWNLIKNSVKFTPAGGTITIDVSNAPDGRLVVKVIDNGIGIDSEVLPRIFAAFEQGDPNVTRQFGGLGLGLAISRLLAERHEGSLSAESAGKGLGATFTLTLPTLDGPPPPRPAGDATPRRDIQTLRILLVEDHRETARLLGRLLRDLGHDVTAAYDLTSALRCAADGQFDLLVSDVRLPDGSGYDLMDQLNSRGMKAIALTGYGTEVDIRQSLAVGFDCHLTKPVTLEQLVRAIDGVMR